VYVHASLNVGNGISKIFENGHTRVALKIYDFEVFTVFSIPYSIMFPLPKSFAYFEPPNLKDYTHHTVL